jgi:hypothetical protein
MQEAIVNSIFQPDSLAPVQYQDTMRRAVPLEPEKKLMLAVLEDAVMCFQENVSARDKKRRQLFLETEQWIFEERSDRLFAFENLCFALNLNPQYIRAGLRQWQQRHASQQIPVSHKLQAALLRETRAYHKRRSP